MTIARRWHQLNSTQPIQWTHAHTGQAAAAACRHTCQGAKEKGNTRLDPSIVYPSSSLHPQASSFITTTPPPTTMSSGGGGGGLRALLSLTFSSPPSSSTTQEQQQPSPPSSPQSPYSSQSQEAGMEEGGAASCPSRRLWYINGAAYELSPFLASHPGMYMCWGLGWRGKCLIFMFIFSMVTHTETHIHTPQSITSNIIRHTQTKPTPSTHPSIHIFIYIISYGHTNTESPPIHRST